MAMSQSQPPTTGKLLSGGPYRATRLWNEAIRIFNNGVPRKRHWRQLRQYENCFTAIEATSWLHTQLKANPNFGPNVTKDQVQQLLCKFLKAGVFEDVRGVESTPEHFKENSGLYRLTNRSPFRNPRTPGRTPLGTIQTASSSNRVDEGGCGTPRRPAARSVKAALLLPGKEKESLVTQCQVSARQLRQDEVEEIWKKAALRQVANITGLQNLKGLLDTNQIKAKWVLWNVSKIGVRGVVQPMEETDCPPSWVLYGMKSLVNWPSNENHKLPDYSGSERDVFKVICDYFTNASGPLATFALYNLLVEAFIRAEAADLQFRQQQPAAVEETDEAQQEDLRSSCSTLSSRSSSVRSLVMKMASPAIIQRGGKKTSTPIGQDSSSDYPLGPVLVKSPIMQRRRAIQQDALSCCYETAFTTAEPRTRIVHQSHLLTRRSQSSDLILEQEHPSLGDQMKEAYVYRSLDRLRSKSGGYVNVACLDDGAQQLPDVEWHRAELWTPSTASIRSVSSLSSQRTGLSPSSFTTASSGASPDYAANWRHFAQPVDDDQSPSFGGSAADQQKLRSYRNSPSKRLVGRRKGLEFYYGAKACRPGLVTAEGKAKAIESLQVLTLLLPPDLRRKLHLLLRFMTKASANRQLVLDPSVPLKTLMINTFYRCIVSSADESDYDELLAVRLVTFMMENAEAVMTVPPRLCAQVRDTLLQLQREKVRFHPVDEAVPLAFCRQVSPERFERQRVDESGQAIQQLLEHIIADAKMSERDRRKRLKQFRTAYPEIYYAKFPLEKGNEENSGMRMNKPPTTAILARIKSLRLV